MIIQENVELTRQGGEGGWLAVGSDPSFKVSYPFVRDRFIVIHLYAEDVELDPRLYIDNGRGVNETDSVSFPSGRGFIFIVDVGRLGTGRRFRFDPASFPCAFGCEVVSFIARIDVERFVSERIASSGISLTQHSLRLPRFVLKLPSFARAKRGEIAMYADVTYQLAAELPPAEVVAGGKDWLSIIVPVFNSPPRYLNKLLESVLAQAVSGIELILSDDASDSLETKRWLDSIDGRYDNIRVLRHAVNRGIAATTNDGIRSSSGRWVTLVDHDDLLAPFALKVIEKALRENPDIRFLYTDELIVDDELRPIGCMLKPAYDPVLLSGVNYINHLSIYRRETLNEIGLLRLGFDGSQDYDLLLRYLAAIPEEAIAHLPYPAYWWRNTHGSFSSLYIQDATIRAREALKQAFGTLERKVDVIPALTDTLHRVIFSEPHNGWPKISVIVPNKDSFSLIAPLLSDLFERTVYPDFEVIVVDNGTVDEDVLQLYKQTAERHPNFSVLRFEAPFNFSAAINRGINAAVGEHYLLLNNDIRVIESGWIMEMVSCLSYSTAGIVGAKLLYPTNLLQHAGVIVGFGDLAGHWYLNQSGKFGGPMNRLHVRNSFNCVTGAAMLISGSCAASVGLWDEENFAIAYNDVDYCLRARRAGYRVIWTPFASLYHHESASRGSDETVANSQRFEREKANLKRRHNTENFMDSSISPAYSRSDSVPRIVPPTSLFGPRKSDGSFFG